MKFKKLEPVAESLLEEMIATTHKVDLTITNGVSLLSIAASLKRIADALESDSEANLFDHINNLASAVIVATEKRG